MAIAIAGIGCALLSQTAPLRDLEYVLVETPFFHLREALGQSPVLSDKIRIFAYDDYSLEKLQKPTPTLAQLTTMINAIASRNPKIIFIDAVLKILDGTEKEVNGFLTAVENAGVVVTGAYLSAKDNPTGEAVLKKPFYNIEHYSDVGLDHRNITQETMTFTGPHPALANKVFGVGHIQYQERHRMPSILKLNDKQVLPSVALFDNANPKDSLRRLASLIDPTSDLVVNFSPSMDYYNRTLPIYTLLSAASSRPEYIKKMVNDGDIVVLLPLMYSGNVDLTNGPFGPIPRGLALTSMLNSSITNNWLVGVTSPITPYFLVAALFALLSVVQGNMRFLVAAGSIFGLHIIVGFALFSAGWIVPWLGSAMLTITLTLAFITYRFLMQSKHATVLRQTLQGILPSDKIQRFLKNPELLQRDPAEKFVTIMFIDIAGFSLRAKEGSAKETFDLLKAQLQMMTRLVHKHKGVVDKTLGDGLLAFFGYDFDCNFDASDKNASFRNQADHAVRCAIEIQLTNARLGLENPHQPFYPLRIGINSDNVYIGDVGHEGRVEYTIIGNGVNMAQRFETACAHNSVLIGLATINRLQEMSKAIPKLFTKLIKIKHDSSLHEVFELDPFWNQRQERQAVESLFRDQMGYLRTADRWRLSSPVAVDTDRGPGMIVDMSAGGIALVHESYLGSQVDLRLYGNEDFPFNLVAEVRWGVPYGDRFLLGLKFANVQHEQVEKLKSYVQSETGVSHRR